MSILKRKTLFSVVAFCLTALQVVTAEESVVTEYPLWENGAPGSEGITEKEIVVERGKDGVVDRSFSNVHQPTITLIQPATPSRKPRPAMIICPGGGFSRVVLDKEGNDFARFLNQYGITGITLKYRTAKSEKNWYGISAPEADVKRAIRLARANAGKWNLDRNRIGVFGFSAGGFIASTAATHYEYGRKDATDPVIHYSSKPNFLGLAYPVISMQPGVNREAYRKMLLGVNVSDSSPQVKLYSNELQVNSKTPPSFVCHARDDSGVPVKNSELFKAACDKAGVECTTFIQDKGGHGFGIRDQGFPINQWKHEFILWMKKHRLTDS